MPLREIHRQLASVALRAASEFGFALGGGNALIAHGIIDRFTQDVDLFTDDEGGIGAAAGAVEASLRAAGFDTERRDRTSELADVFEGMDDGLAEWVLNSPDGERTMLQLAYFDRARAPILMDLGPVLDLEDVIGGKICALASRVEPRDFVDTAFALRRYSVAEVIGFARRLDPGLGRRDFADAGRRLDDMGDGVFADSGFGPRDVALLRRQFAAWPRA